MRTAPGRDGIRHRDVERAGEALVAVRAVQRRAARRRVALEDGPRRGGRSRRRRRAGWWCPSLAVSSCVSPSRSKRAPRDAVAEAADRGAEVAAVGDVGAWVGVAEHDADRAPVGVRDLEAAHRGAGRQHLEQEALGAAARRTWVRRGSATRGSFGVAGSTRGRAGRSAVSAATGTVRPVARQPRVGSDHREREERRP